jgi:ferredoxin-type protein NapH
MKEHIAFLQQRSAKQLVMSCAFLVLLFAAWFYPLLGFFIPVCMVAGLGIAFFKGRKWCDWYCPRGSFWDAIMERFSRKKKIPAFVKALPFRALMVVLMMAIMISGIIRTWPNPYRIGTFFVAILTVTTVLGIALASFYHQRIWCFLCPIGTMANLAGRKKYMLRIASSKCVECKLCAKVCPVAIKPYRYKKEGQQLIMDFDCLKCGSCVASCPKKSLSFGDVPKRDRS